MIHLHRRLRIVPSRFFRSYVHDDAPVTIGLNFKNIYIVSLVVFEIVLNFFRLIDVRDNHVS